MLQGGTKPPISSDVSFLGLAELTPGFTGADLGGLVREASLQALKESLRSCTDSPANDKNDEEVLVVNNQHFLDALKNIKPSVTDEVSDRGVVCHVIGFSPEPPFVSG